MRRALLVALLALSAREAARADLLSTALISFPATTEYLEYDNLASLRTLPNYKTLRQRFAGKSLEDAKTALGKLGIIENQVTEVVVGSHENRVYGLATGTFSGEVVATLARRKGYTIKELERQLFCPAGEMCVVFLEDSLAAFGTQKELKGILEARQGMAMRLSSNRDVATLLDNTEHHAAVRGVVFGAQLKATVSNMLRDWSGLNGDWSRLCANVSVMAYSVAFDDQAHIAASLECTTTAAATLLVQTLSALGSLQSAVAGPAGKLNANALLQHLQATASSGNIVGFKADSPWPTAVQAGR